MGTMRCIFFCLAGGVLLLSGCYAPLHSPGVEARTLPDSFRYPVRSRSCDINYAMLTRLAPDHYLLGEGDLLSVEIFDLVPQARRLPPLDPDRQGASRSPAQAFEVRLPPDGQILLPLVGFVRVDNLTIEQARRAITKAYAEGFLDRPRVSVTLLEKGVRRVLVTGSVARPDVYELPRFENDIAHAITRAGGVLDEADEIEVHRRIPVGRNATSDVAMSQAAAAQSHRLQTLRISLRSPTPLVIAPQQTILNDGDVVKVRSRPEEVFFVVGKLSSNNLVRFSLNRESRDIGNGFVLPRDRDVDVVTAVAMAGYIDPIDSPTTVTVHRTTPQGDPLLIRVDLIAARSDRKENIMVQPGDIIYLNPDTAWWFRRTFDRIVPDLLTFPYERAILEAFGQERR